MIEIDGLNLKLKEFCRKYDGIIKVIFIILLIIVCISLTIYFLDIHIYFKEIAQNSQQWCWDNYPIKINLTGP